MSGIRAENKELVELGLTLPGFVERSKVIAPLPSLSLLTLAGMTPEDFDISYHEIHDFTSVEDLPDGFDLVALTTLSAQVFEAYKVAAHFRRLGTPVVMGGLHVSSMPDEALRHCDAVVVGEGENVWPHMLDDFKRGSLKPVYHARAHGEFDLAHAPMPRFDLLDPAKYKAHYKQLMRELAKEDLRWFTESDLSVADDPDLLSMMRDAGCQQVLIGLESPRPASLRGIDLKSDWKARRRDGYLTAIERIQSHGITVNGCFILGLEGDTPTVFDELFSFVRESGLYEVLVTMLTPFPGTPLYRQLLEQGRIIEPGNWNLCTLFDLNIIPGGMTPEELQQGFLRLVGSLYSGKETSRRRRAFHKRRVAGRRMNKPQLQPMA